MKKMRYIALFLMLTGIFQSGCEKANDWGVQPEYEGLFRPLVFEKLATGATNITVKHTKVVDADKYIFEFSDDSLVFGNIVRRVEVLADTLTPFSESSTVTKTEYRTLFEDFDASSKILRSHTGR
ncbi:MAG: hypothetical protein QM786_05145 [Breznakibacter sp.]